jgi:Short C-terminal domain
MTTERRRDCDWTRPPDRARLRRTVQDENGEVTILTEYTTTSRRPLYRRQHPSSRHDEPAPELAKLKEQGILTEEEFQAKKKQILDL